MVSVVVLILTPHRDAALLSTPSRFLSHRGELDLVGATSPNVLQTTPTASDLLEILYDAITADSGISRNGCRGGRRA